MRVYPGDEAYTACYSPENIAAADADFRRNTELLRQLFEEGETGAVPAYVLDGDLLDLPPAGREDALMERLETLE